MLLGRHGYGYVMICLVSSELTTLSICKRLQDSRTSEGILICLVCLVVILNIQMHKAIAIKKDTSHGFIPMKLACRLSAPGSAEEIELHVLLLFLFHHGLVQMEGFIINLWDTLGICNVM